MVIPQPVNPFIDTTHKDVIYIKFEAKKGKILEEKLRTIQAIVAGFGIWNSFVGSLIVN